MDEDGNSALNLLLKLLHGSELKAYLEQYTGVHEHNNNVYQEIVKSATMLLQAKANPNICNKDGDRSLHILVHVGHTPFLILHTLLSLLLTHGANPNVANYTASRTILSLLVYNGTRSRFGLSARVLSHIDGSDVELFVNCVRLLHKHGCRVERSRHTGPECLLHMVFIQLDKLDHVSTMAVDLRNRIKLSSGLVRYITQITQCLLECGCVPNVCETDQSDLDYLYYKLIVHSDLIPFEQTLNLLVLVLQYGANANRGGHHIAMSVLRLRTSHESCPIFPLLHLMNMWGMDCSYTQSQLLTLFNLFYSVMDPKEARCCLVNYTQFDKHHRSHDPNKDCAELDKYAETIFMNPRPIKMLCAMAVYDLLDRKILLANQLPLPKPLCKYLTSLQF